MILTGQNGKKIIGGDPQAHGVDVKVTNVYQTILKGIDEKVFDNDYIALDKFRENDKYYWELWPQQAVLFELEIVNLSKENVNDPVVGFVLPKSRYSRCGLIVHSALFDYGYKGKGKILVFNSSNKTQKIYENSYFGQMIFLTAQQGDKIYNGSHNNEGLK